jgi:hypothetical protein
MSDDASSIERQNQLAKVLAKSRKLRVQAAGLAEEIERLSEEITHNQEPHTLTMGSLAGDLTPPAPIEETPIERDATTEPTRPDEPTPR